MNGLTNFFSDDIMASNNKEEQMIREYPISKVAHEDWLSFAMYTVESRAIPNFCDGLKPVQRFYLYSSIENSKKEFKKVSAIAGVLSSCIVGDTNIKLADGNDVTIASLYNSDEDYINVMSFSIDNEVEADIGYNIQITKTVDETIVLEFENGFVLECTRDHKIAINDNGRIIYKRADMITENDDVITM
jgi:hypothetical protein